MMIVNSAQSNIYNIIHEYATMHLYAINVKYHFCEMSCQTDCDFT